MTTFTMGDIVITTSPNGYTDDIAMVVAVTATTITVENDRGVTEKFTRRKDGNYYLVGTNPRWGYAALLADDTIHPNTYEQLGIRRPQHAAS